MGRDRAVGRPHRSSRPLPHRSSAARVRRCHARVAAASGSGESQYTTHTAPAPAPPPGAGGVDNGAIKDVALFWIIGGVAYYLKMQVRIPTLLSSLTANAAHTSSSTRNLGAGVRPQ
jgi:hypothetical protein